MLTIPPGSRPDVLLEPAAAAVIEADARRRAPEEACGLLAGCLSAGLLRILAAVPLDNLADDPTRAFRLDPLPLLTDPPPASGGAWIGVYHSHPAAPPEPSAADLAAAWTDLLQLVLGHPGTATATWCAFVRRVGATDASPLCLRNATDG